MAIQEKRIHQDIETINGFNAIPGNGITRLTFSQECQKAVTYVVNELIKIGAGMDLVIAPRSIPAWKISFWDVKFYWTPPSN